MVPAMSLSIPTADRPCFLNALRSVFLTLVPSQMQR